MSTVESFLTAEEEQEIVNAIRTAEKQTSGEIRVHIENYTETKPVYNRAQEVFHLLKMNNTKAKNGVILYIATNQKKFVVYGDKGINDIVGSNFWNATRDSIQNQFKKGHFKQGIIDGVLQIGEALKAHFPWQTNDENELSDEISKG